MTLISKRSWHNTWIRDEWDVRWTLIVVAVLYLAPAPVLAQTEGEYLYSVGFFHIEFFAGLPGKREELIEQRRMESRFYKYLDRQQNVMFVREAGSNWDVMTIGFHESLQAFAAAGNLHSEAEQDEAAKAAGFEGVGDIGPYLRSLLSYHHDTLAVSVR